ncbi:MAG TPA: phage tail protein [Kineosporiaceae bacterium]|nr:phage tail protein [Kineosporiaceae bacterium]
MTIATSPPQVRPESGSSGRSPSPHPLGATLPAVYLDDSFTQRFCSALDEILARDIAVLDCFPAYLDPGTAPPDLLDWLASWLGLAGARTLPVERRRRLVARAAELHAWRGTPRAVRELVELASGLPADIEESGGTSWSREAGAPLPGRGRPALVVRLRTGGDRVGVDEDLLARLLELVVPAHLPWRLELSD